MLAKGQITVTNLDDGKTPFLHQAYKMKDGRFLKHYPVYEAPPVNGYKEGDLWHWNGEDYPGRNLLLNSKTLLTSRTNEVVSFLGREGVVKVSNPTNAMYIVPIERLSDEVNSEDDYVLSVDSTYIGTKGSTPQLYIERYQPVEGAIEDSKFNRIYIRSKRRARIHMHFSGFEEIYLNGWKLEKGNKATDWTPAPEDLTGGKQSGYFVANKSSTTFDFNDWTFYADELAYSDTDKFYPKFEGTYSDYNEVASDDQTKYTWKIIQADNVPSITTVSKEYYLSTSNTSTVGGTWSEKIPPWTTGKFYWSRMHTIFVDGTIKTSTPVLDEGLNLSLVTTLEVKATTQTLSTTVSQQAGQIALKANTTDVNTLTGRVTSAEGSITTIAGQVALKANSSDVNTLTGRVTTAEGSITTQAGQIALKANQSVVDTLTGRVSTAEAKITATDGKVTTLTTKTDGHTTSIGQLQTSYDGLSSTVTALETGKVGTTAFSALEQNLNGFKTTVANTYADKTTVTQLSTQWTTTTNLVNGHTSQIASLGTDINLRATKTEVDDKILADKTIKDTRTTNQLPHWYYTNYPKQKAYEFKQCTTIGLPTSAGVFASVVTEVPWVEVSGGPIEQTATATDGVYQRRGTTAWSAWAKVADSSNIISQINISPESILIASKKIQIKGDTYIDNGVIKTAHIEDLAVSGAKIANASISSAKIISLDVNKIVGNTTSFIQSYWNGISTTVSINANGLVSQSGAGLATSLNAGALTTTFGTKTGIADSNGYTISDTSNGKNTRLNSEGIEFGWYDNRRAIVQNSEGLEIRAYTGSDYRLNSALYLITGNDPNASAYLQLMNSATGLTSRLQLQGTVLQLRNPAGGYLSVGDSNFNERFGRIHAGVFRTSVVSGEYLEMVESQIQTKKGGNQNIYIIPSGNAGVTIGGGGDGQKWPVTALRFIETSNRNSKVNIEVFAGSGLDVINDLVVTTYNRKDDLARGINRRDLGFIAEDSPKIASPQTDGLPGIDNYLTVSYLVKSVQELSTINTNTNKRINTTDSNIIKLVANDSIYGLRLNNLESEVFRLKKRIEELEKIA